VLFRFVQKVGCAGLSVDEKSSDVGGFHEEELTGCFLAEDPEGEFVRCVLFEGGGGDVLCRFAVDAYVGFGNNRKVRHVREGGEKHVHRAFAVVVRENPFGLQVAHKDVGGVDTAGGDAGYV